MKARQFRKGGGLEYLAGFPLELNPLVRPVSNLG
jgi:hypothetical protein